MIVQRTLLLLKLSWDNYYKNDLIHAEDNDEPAEISELESWFDDVGAPAKTLAFLTSDACPLAPSMIGDENLHPTVLDVGSGNGSSLLSLRIEGGYRGLMVGVDYSESSVQLARKLALQQNASPSVSTLDGQGNDSSTRFEVFDVMKDEAEVTDWWPFDANGFDLVLDKGTFDAISLSSETYQGADGFTKRIHEGYPEKVAKLIRPGGLFLITSCNWTQTEIEDWFTKGVLLNVLQVFHIIRYPSFQFGGQKGQGAVSICFQKASDASRISVTAEK